MNNTNEQSNITSGGLTNDDVIDCAEHKVLEAAKIGNVNLLDICISQRHVVPFNIRNLLRKETLAHLGAQTDHLNVVEWCLKKDRNFFLDSRDHWNNTILHAAVLGEGSINMVDFIVSQSIPILYEKNERGYTVLYEAVIHGRREMLSHLLDQHHMPLMNSTIAIMAAEFRQEPIITFLLEREPSLAHFVDGCGSSLLHWTAYRNLPNVTELLCQKYGVQHRADCNGEFPMNLALRLREFEVAAQLVRDCHANYLQRMSTAPHDTSTHVAARKGGILTLWHLDKKNITYQELRNDLGQIPIMLAVESRDIYTIQHLIRGDAPMDFKDNAGNTILHYTACDPSLKVVENLFNAPQNYFIKLHARNEAGETSMFAAVECDNLPFVRFLFEKGASISDDEFENLLMAAVKRDNLTMVEYLMNYPLAEHLLKKKYGNTAPDYWKSEEMRNFFEARFPEMVFKSRRVINTGDFMHLNCSDVIKQADFSSLKNLLDVKMQPQGENVAHCAAREDQLEMLRWLLEETTVDFLRRLDLLNNTILHAAAFGGSARAVDYIASRADSRDFLLQKNTDGFNALHVAAAEGHEAVAKVLVNRWGLSPGIRTSIEENTAALVAAKYNHHDILLWFLRKEPGIAPAVGKCGFNVLNWVTYNNNATTADILCREYAVRGSSNCYGEYPIHIALRRKEFYLAEVLVDVCDQNLLQQRSNPPRDTTAHDAARSGRLDILLFLDFLLFGKGGLGGYSKMKNDFGKAPIFVAVDNNQTKIVEFLVGKGDYLYLTDSDGNTILHQMACHSRLELFQKLSRCCMLPSLLSKKNNAGQTLVYKAVMCDNLELIKYLITYFYSHTDFNIPASDNTTAFHAAIMSDNFKIVDYMLGIGVGQEVPVSEGVKEPWEYAKTKRMRDEVRDYLEPLRWIKNRRFPPTRTPRVLQKREVRMADRLDYPRLETSTESTSVSIPETGLLSNTLLLLDTILKKIFGRKSNYGSNISDLPPSPPEVLRSKIDPLALEAIYQAERFEGLTDDDESDG